MAIDNHENEQKEVKKGSLVVFKFHWFIVTRQDSSIGQGEHWEMAHGP